MEEEKKEEEVKEEVVEGEKVETAAVEENKNEKVDDTQVTRKPEAPKKKKAGIKVVVILLIIILLCILGYAAYLNFYTTKKTVKVEKDNYKSEYRLSGNGLEDFDLYFMKLENDKKNSVYSPLSIKYALAMLSEGAKGETKEQIDAIIGDYKAKSYPNNEHMSFANAMFIRDTYKDAVKEDYIKNLKDKFGAEVIIDPFASPNNINDWASNRTFKLVNNLLDDVSKNNFFLINALAIDMNWNNQIQCEYSHKIPCVNDGNYHISYSHEKLEDDAEEYYSVTMYPYYEEDLFYGNEVNKHEFNGQEYIKGGEVLADFNKYDIIKDLGEDKIREIIKPEYEEWQKTEYGKKDLPLEQGLDRFIKELKENYGKAQNSTDFLVHEDGNVKVFAKDLQKYDDMTLQYVGIMPKEVELDKFIKDTNSDEINGIIKQLKEVKIDSFEDGYVYRIRGFIPFFKFEDELKLLDDLEELGVKDVFDSDNADLSNMVKGPAYIDKAIHKANIEFSNDGIRASAVTAGGGAGATHGPYFEHLFKVPVKEIDVTFNKPYMYIIRDKDTGEVWFTGTVYEPIKK